MENFKYVDYGCFSIDSCKANLIGRCDHRWKYGPIVRVCVAQTCLLSAFCCLHLRSHGHSMGWRRAAITQQVLTQPRSRRSRRSRAATQLGQPELPLAQRPRWSTPLRHQCHRCTTSGPSSPQQPGASEAQPSGLVDGWEPGFGWTHTVQRVSSTLLGAVRLSV